jgi:hypothetical protein
MIIDIDILISLATIINIVINKLDFLRLFIIICINSFSLYEYIVKFSITKEKRLIINIIVIH